jgi:rhodanese-related sulfurtransferase
VSWEQIDALIARDFPAVQHLETQQLEDWLNDPQRQPPVVLDVREIEEYSVSRLPGARHFPAGSRLTVNAAVVVYCSVGYRSARIANQLAQAGGPPVFNLRGSIFKWANEGKPLEANHGAAAAVVHPFDNKWSALLDAALHAPIAHE